MVVYIFESQAPLPPVQVQRLRHAGATGVLDRWQLSTEPGTDPMSNEVIVAMVREGRITRPVLRTPVARARQRALTTLTVFPDRPMESREWCEYNRICKRAGGLCAKRVAGHIWPFRTSDAHMWAQAARLVANYSVVGRQLPYTWDGPVPPNMFLALDPQGARQA